MPSFPIELRENEDVQPGDRLEITDRDTGNVWIKTVAKRDKPLTTGAPKWVDIKGDPIFPEYPYQLDTAGIAARYSYRILYRQPILNQEEDLLLAKYRTLSEEKQRTLRKILEVL